MNNGTIGGIAGRGANIFDTSKTSFGDNPFLQLLIAQMRSQTPLEPMDNASFMSQMSDFSNMEQQKELNSNLLGLLQFQGALARLNGLTQGAGMIGREVEFANDKGKLQKGIVTAVRVSEAGEVLVRVGKLDVKLSQVVSVRGGQQNSGSDSGKSSKSHKTGDKSN